MQFFPLLIICTVMLNDFLVKLLNLPTVLHFLPEVLSGLVVVYVAAAGTRNRFRLVQSKYWIIFAAFSVIILFGIINNPPGSGPAPRDSPARHGRGGCGPLGLQEFLPAG